MARKPVGIAEDLLVGEQIVEMRSIGGSHTRESHDVDRRHVYAGDPQSNTPSYAARPTNKRVMPKKTRSTFNIVALLFLTAISIVAYIGNILSVNRLAVEVHQLQSEFDKITNSNGVSKAEINRKSSLERIGTTAKEKLGLMYAKEHPQSIDVDETKLVKFRNR